ncbi:MAG: pantoate--beta-alanine ligase [Salinisphaera sp.]|jgi:pantoate--beta-alanine ligase|nr:pantoate--beta-alanine ligase [Salinisphaera sp.]
MKILETTAAVAQWRLNTSGVIGLVPTMGNLHAGHMALVNAACQRCDRVIVSIFVNPMQFGPNEDLATYPRTFDADCAALRHAGVEAVFAPSVSEMYPQNGASLTTVHVDDITGMLCGNRRPGHFDGVATVVAKLFNIVRPNRAFFGEKDFQQLAVVRRMSADLCTGVEIAGVATVRDADGLALSSRNQYLTADERRRALALPGAIGDCVTALRRGDRDFRSLEARAWSRMSDAGFDPDYVEIRQPDLAPATAASSAFRVLAAGHLGQTRLIDNMGMTV